MRDEPALPGAHLSSRMKKLRSDVTMMERLTSHDRPLYGRAREDVIDAFNPAEVGSAMGSGVSAMKTFDAYLATGGYPKLVDDFARAGSVEAYVASGLSDDNSDLIVMAQRSLDAEFPPDAQARRVLSAIGGQDVGHSTFSSVVNAWWNRDHSVEVDIVATSARAVVAVGSIKWRPRSQFKRHELDVLTASRAVVAHAATARLIAVCPAGFAEGVKPDVALNAEDPLAAWAP